MAFDLITYSFDFNIIISLKPLRQTDVLID